MTDQADLASALLKSDRHIATVRCTGGEGHGEKHRLARVYDLPTGRVVAIPSYKHKPGAEVVHVPARLLPLDGGWGDAESRCKHGTWLVERAYVASRVEREWRQILVHQRVVAGTCETGIEIKRPGDLP